MGEAPITGITHLKAFALDCRPALLRVSHSSFSSLSLLAFSPLPLLAVSVCDAERTGENRKQYPNSSVLFTLSFVFR